MKRRMKLIYKILEWCETYADNSGQPPPDLEGYQQNEINYHIELCVEAGFLHADYQPVYQIWKIFRLTWNGHEELAKRRGNRLAE